MDPRFEEIREQSEEREKVYELMHEYERKATWYCMKYGRLDRMVAQPYDRFCEDTHKIFASLCKRSKIKPFWYEGKDYRSKSLTKKNIR